MFTANHELSDRSAGAVAARERHARRDPADRKEPFLEVGRRIVDLSKRYYERDDESVLPRSIANFEAFENAMTLDIAMGGSTNTVLHLLAVAEEAA